MGDVEFYNRMKKVSSQMEKLGLPFSFQPEEYFGKGVLDNTGKGKGLFTSQRDLEFDTGMEKISKQMEKLGLPYTFQTNKKDNLEVDSDIVRFSPDMKKYWVQRYSLFSRYDDGIKMDIEGWFSVTQEKIAEHHALRCGDGTIVDCFTGVGGNVIQFAMKSRHVIVIDIDRKKIACAQHNATLYKVANRIDFLVGDNMLLTPKLKVDTVFVTTMGWT